MKEFLKALKKGEAFNWINFNYNDLSKTELMSIIKAYDRALDCECFTAEDYQRACELIATTFKED